MRPGQLVRLTTFKHNASPAFRVGFKAPKGKVFVLALLGMEDKDGTKPLNIEDAMEMMGWTRKEE